MTIVSMLMLTTSGRLGCGFWLTHKSEECFNFLPKMNGAAALNTDFQKPEVLLFWSNDVLNREKEMKLSENRFPKTVSLPAKSKSKKMLTDHDYILGKG